MKIKTIHADHFGKFLNYSLGLADGFNIIYGNNEDGKSTLMAFLRMMFYGGDNRGDLLTGLRKKYQPWAGGAMAGSVEFEKDGLQYRLTREFRGGNSTDRIEAIKLAANQKVAFTGDPGQFFFGLGEASFERSVFIGQAGSLPEAKNGGDELTQKLRNLILSGEEAISPEQALKNLNDAIELQLSRSGKIGALDKLNAQLAILNGKKLGALDEEAAKKRMEGEIAALTAEEDSCAKEYERLRKLLRYLRVYLSLDGFLQSREALERAVTETEHNGKTFGAAFVQQAEQQVNALHALNATCRERAQEAQRLEKDAQDGASLPEPGTAARIQALERQRQSAQEESARLRRQAEYAAYAAESERHTQVLYGLEQEANAAADALSQAGARFTDAGTGLKEGQAALDAGLDAHNEANTAHLLAQQNEANVRTQAERDIAAARALLELVQAAPAARVKPGARLPLFIAAACTLAVSVLLGALVHPLGYLGAIAAAALLAIGLATERGSVSGGDDALATARRALEEAQREGGVRIASAAAHTAEARVALERAQAGYAALSAALAAQKERHDMFARERAGAQDKKAELDARLSSAKERRAGYERELAKRQGDAADPADLERISAQAEERAAQAEELAQKIAGSIASAGCASAEELAQKDQRSAELRTRLADARTALEQAKEKTALGEADLVALVGHYSPVQTAVEAEEALRRLKDALGRADALRARTQGQWELVHKDVPNVTDADAGQTAATLRDALSRAGQPLTEEGLHALEQAILDCDARWRKLHDQVTNLTSDMRNRFAGQKTVSDIEEEIRGLCAEIAERTAYCDSLRLARQTLQEAADEAEQLFSPQLNAHTADIFTRLTGGRYQNVLVAPQTFDIRAQEAAGSMLREWKYLSSGTVDQAYLALRLAIAGELTKAGPPLPLLLDDVLLQYDDRRMEQGLRFLAEEAQRAQIVLFTCRQSIADWGAKTAGVQVSALAQGNEAIAIQKARNPS